jgi:hypothetical protein
MKAPDELIADLMRRSRAVLYNGKPEKAWYQQQDTVKKALTFPAAWLEERKVPMTASRYGEIMGGILNTMVKHGQLQSVAYPGAYLLHVVQQHMAHHGDKYYEECKSNRHSLSLNLASIEKAIAARQAVPNADVIAPFAQAHAVLQTGKRKPKIKAVATPLQPDLFGTANRTK